MTTDTLAAFLEARLQEDQAAAMAAPVDPAGAMDAMFETEALHEEQDWRLYPERETEYARGQAAALHWAATAMRERMVPITLHDPARVLREVAAKRAILGEHRQNGPDSIWCWRCDPGADMGDGAMFPCVTLRAVAAVYSAHPDYDPAWAPEPATG